MDGSVYWRLARAQGVARPYEILVRMHPVGRALVADLLGCRLHACIDPHAQAWRIINQNLRGLQARTHALHETLSPFARNNNWWEIVTRTARRLGVTFYPGIAETEVERLVFECFAGRFAGRCAGAEVAAVDSVARAHPVLDQVMAALRLSGDAAHGLLVALARANGGFRDGCLCIADWFRSPMRWTWAVSIANGLGVLKPKLNDVYRSWTAFARAGGGIDRVGAAVAVIYFQDLIDRAVDEFQHC